LIFNSTTYAKNKTTFAQMCVKRERATSARVSPVYTRRTTTRTSATRTSVSWVFPYHLAMPLICNYHPWSCCTPLHPATLRTEYSPVTNRNVDRSIFSVASWKCLLLSTTSATRLPIPHSCRLALAHPIARLSFPTYRALRRHLARAQLLARPVHGARRTHRASECSCSSASRALSAPPSTRA
jgi:hypothetical protein